MDAPDHEPSRLQTKRRDDTRPRSKLARVGAHARREIVTDNERVGTVENEPAANLECDGKNEQPYSRHVSARTPTPVKGVWQ